MPALEMSWGKAAFSDTGGDRPALVFLHGSGCDSADWAETTGRLPPGCRVTTMDFRGHGGSDVPARPFELRDLANDVLALVRCLEIRKVLLVGHSLGGMVAMDAAPRCDRVAGLVLLEGWTRLEANYAFEGDRMYGLLAPSAIEAIRRKAEMAHQRLTQQLWEHFWKSVESFDAEPFLRATRMPVIEVYGGMGRKTSPRKKLLLPEKANIELIWIPGTGHYLPHERPAEVAEACLLGAEKAGLGS